MKKFFLIFLIIFFSKNSLSEESIKPLTNYTFNDVVESQEVNYLIIEGCVSLYSAITELTKKRYPDLAKQFFEIANTIYPYGIIALSKLKNLSYENAEKKFFEKVNNLSELYMMEMNRNGKKTGSYFKYSFLAEDLTYCHEVTKSLQLLVLESL